MPQDKENVRCRDCRHYYVTHQVNFRYGCRALDFKSRREPATEVREASGQSCQYFHRKATQFA